MTRPIMKKGIIIIIVIISVAISIIAISSNTYGATESKIELSKCDITLEYTKAYCTGKTRHPAVTVKYNGKKVNKKDNYTVTSENNKYPGTAKVYITAKGDKFTGTVVKTFKIYTKPVSKISVSSSGSDSIKLSWNKVAGAKKYKIVVTQDGYKYKKGTYTTNATSYKFTEVPAGYKYQFKITVLAGPKNTPSSTKTKTFTLNKSTTTAAVKVITLSKPKVSVNSPGYRRNDVSWNKVDNAVGYYVTEYNVTTKETVTETVADASITSMSFYDKKEGSSYQYKVQAYRIDGEKTIKSDWSESVTVKVAGTYIGQACGNYDGKAGDSSGKEVTRSKWRYSSSKSPYNWTYVFRFKDSQKAETVAAMCEIGIDNNLIGYCSKGTSTYGKNAVQNQVSKYNYDLSKVTVATGFSCGDLITASCIYAGIKCKYTGSGLDVAKELKQLSDNFECITDPVYVESDAYLQRGDILVTAHPDGKSNHVCIVL